MKTCRSAVSALAVLLIALVAGCAVRPASPHPHQWERPLDNDQLGVRNHGKVTPYLWRGAQPRGVAEFRKLEALGVKTILNLRAFHDDFPELADTKLKYVRIPMFAHAPGQGQGSQLILALKTIEKLTKDPASRPVYVHCRGGNDRTGFTVAAYRMLYEDWTPDEAIQEMFDYGFHSLLFPCNPTYLRKLDVRRTRELLGRAP